MIRINPVGRAKTLQNPATCIAPIAPAIVTQLTFSSQVVDYHCIWETPNEASHDDRANAFATWT